MERNQTICTTKGPPSSQVLSLRKEEIEGHWAADVKKQIKEAQQLSEPVLFNLVPKFLDRLILALKPDSGLPDAVEGSTVAQEHGIERAKYTGLDIGQVTTEFLLLRHAIYEGLEGKAELTSHDRLIIDRSIDRATSEAITGFTQTEKNIREQVLARLAHDIRNPLTIIDSAIQIIQKNGDNRPLVESMVAKAHANTQKITALLQDILDLSLLRGGQTLPIRCQQTDLLELVEACARARIEKPLIEGASIIGFWSHQHLTRVVDNLLDNAYKHGTPGRPVKVFLSAEQDQAHIAVHNEGEPIPAQQQQDLLTDLFRPMGAPQGEKKGWGMGLPIIRGIVEAHGGTIDVKSAIDAGTTFRVRLPLDSRPHENKYL